MSGSPPRCPPPGCGGWGGGQRGAEAGSSAGATPMYRRARSRRRSWLHAVLLEQILDGLPEVIALGNTGSCGEGPEPPDVFLGDEHVGAHREAGVRIPGLL